MFNCLWYIVLYCHLQHHNDTIIKTNAVINDAMIRTDAMTKTQEDFFNKIYIPLTLFVRVQKGYSRFACERELEIEHNCNILTPKLMAVNVVSFSFFWCSTGALGSTLLGAGFLYCILSASSLDPNSSGLPEGPFGRVWLSLPHLVSNSIRSSTQLAVGLNWWLELNWVI